MSEFKKMRTENNSEMPPVKESFQGDSTLTVGFDITAYNTLQGRQQYPQNIANVAYETVSLIAVRQGINCRIHGMFTGGTGSLSATLGSGPNFITVSLRPGWTSMVQTAVASVTPGVAFDQTRLVYRAKATIAADNIANGVAGGNSQIIKGSMKTGVIQDFTGDLLTKIESTTVLTKYKMQDSCLRRILLKVKLVTADSCIRSYNLSDILSSQIIWSTTNFICASWATSFVDIISGGYFGAFPISTVPLKQDIVPLGVLPYFYFGDCTLQVIHVVLRYIDFTTGLRIVFVPQPFESLGCMPPSPGYDGTWIGTIVTGYGSSGVPSIVNIQGISSVGLMRMFCPTSIPTIAFTGLSGNALFVNGSAYATAPPANQIPESYGAHPGHIESPENFVDGLRSVFGVNTENEEQLEIAIF